MKNPSKLLKITYTNNKSAKKRRFVVNSKVFNEGVIKWCQYSLAPKMAVPMRTNVDPYFTATCQSSLMPILR